MPLPCTSRTAAGDLLAYTPHTSPILGFLVRQPSEKDRPRGLGPLAGNPPSRTLV